MPESEARNGFVAFFNALHSTVDGPTTWFREKVVVPNQKPSKWYHEQLRRVPTIDQCDTDDKVCIFEAQQQFKRDMKVESEILSILRMRFEDCVLYEAPDIKKCTPLMDIYQEAAANWFTKYGDLGGYATARACYMKQKHRLIWERRHGPVGTGMKSGSEAAPSDE